MSGAPPEIPPVEPSEQVSEPPLPPTPGPEIRSDPSPNPPAAAVAPPTEKSAPGPSLPPVGRAPLPPGMIVRPPRRAPAAPGAPQSPRHASVSASVARSPLIANATSQPLPPVKSPAISGPAPLPPQAAGSGEMRKGAGEGEQTVVRPAIPILVRPSNAILEKARPEAANSAYQLYARRVSRAAMVAPQLRTSDEGISLDSAYKKDAGKVKTSRALTKFTITKHPLGSVKVGLEWDPSKKAFVEFFVGTTIEEIKVMAMECISNGSGKSLDKTEDINQMIVVYRTPNNKTIELDPDRTLVSYALDTSWIELTVSKGKASSKTRERRVRVSKRQTVMNIPSVASTITAAVAAAASGATLEQSPLSLASKAALFAPIVRPSIHNKSQKKSQIPSPASTGPKFSLYEVTAMMCFIKAMLTTSGERLKIETITELFSPAKISSKKVSDFKGVVDKEGGIPSVSSAEAAAATILSFYKSFDTPLIIPTFEPLIMDALIKSPSIDTEALLSNLKKIPIEQLTPLVHLLLFIRNLGNIHSHVSSNNGISSLCKVLQPLIIETSAPTSQSSSGGFLSHHSKKKKGETSEGDEEAGQETEDSLDPDKMEDISSLPLEKKKQIAIVRSVSVVPELVMFSPLYFEDVTALEGEKIMFFVEGLAYIYRGSADSPIHCTVCLTNARVIISVLGSPSIYFPLGSIMNVICESTETLDMVEIVLWTGGGFTFGVIGPEPFSGETLTEAIQFCIRDSVIHPFAAYNSDAEIDVKDWCPYNPRADIAKMRSAKDFWFVSDANVSGKDGFSMCPTYPAEVILPKWLKDVNPVEVADAFVGKRLPALTWVSQFNSRPVEGQEVYPNSCLLRCYSPKPESASVVAAKDFFISTGKKLAFKTFELNAVDMSRLASGGDQTNAMGQAPPWLATTPDNTINESDKGEFEKAVEYFTSRERRCFDVPSASCLQDIYSSIICDEGYWELIQVLVSKGGSKRAFDSLTFFNKKASMSWTYVISQMFNISLEIARTMKEGNSVILEMHNTSCWANVDAVISSLVQVFLDERYRTLDGILELIDKEWSAFGYPFSVCSVLDSETGVSRLSPMFILFIHALYCLVQKYPTRFEFNETFLMWIAEASVGRMFGSFLGNSYAERMAFSKESHSVYTYIRANVSEQRFLNSIYIPASGPLDSLTVPVVVFPWVLFFSKNSCISIQSRRATERFIETSLSKGGGQLTQAALVCIPYELQKEGVAESVTKLELTDNHIQCFPMSVTSLTNLANLSLAKNELSSELLPLDIFNALTANLPQLTSLDLSGNLGLNSLPDSFSLMINLTNLRFDNCSFNEFPRCVLRLPFLRQLSCSGNNIADTLPEGHIAFWESLKLLSMIGCGLTNYPNSWAHFVSLELLDLSDNKLASLPQDFHTLPSLTRLSLRKNAFGEFPAAILGLSKLTKLDLSDNSIRELPASMWRLSSLQSLRISRNGLQTIPTSIGQLTELKELDLKDNAIQELRPTMCLLSKLDPSQFRIEGNPLVYPPTSILYKDSFVGGMVNFESTMSFLRSQLDGNVTQYRLKLIIVGSENVGKTTLIRTLRNKKKVIQASPHSQTEMYNLSTDGIKIDDWAVQIPVEEKDETGKVINTRRQDVNLSVWDFAGQDIYATTHQFFLTERALYLVTWNMEQSWETSAIDQWLWNIRMRAPESPVIIVGTHRDRMPSGGLCKEIITQVLKRYHDMLRGDVPFMGFAVSATTEKGIDSLREGIITTLSKVPYVCSSVPGSFLVLEQMVLDLRTHSTQPLLSYTSFKTLAAQCNIHDDEQIRNAAVFLNQMGTIIYYENDPELQDLIVIDPQWLSDLFTTLITTKANYTQNGRLNTSNLVHIWKPPTFPSSLYPQLLALMEKFEIVFNVSRRKSENLLEDPLDYIVPAILPVTEPSEVLRLSWPKIKGTSLLHCGRVFAFQKYFPPGFFPRLACRILNAAQAEPISLWKHGLLLRRREGTKEPATKGGLVVKPPEGGEEEEDDGIYSTTLIVEDVDNARIIAGVRGEKPIPFARAIFDAIYSLVGDLEMGYAKVYVPCAHCYKNGSESPTQFPLGDVEKAILSGEEWLFCDGVDGECVAIDAARDVSPDLSLSDCDVPVVSISDIEKKEGDVLGMGGAAVVYKATVGGIELAMKELKVGEIAGREEALPVTKRVHGRKTDLGSPAFTEFRREASALSRFKYPSITRLLGVCMKPLALLTELVPYGNLYELVNNKQMALGLDLALKIAHDIACGMCVLHGANPPQLHRDLKSPNVLMSALTLRDTTGRPNYVCAKLTDFGLAGGAYTLRASVENPIWLAPEVMKKEEPTTASDVYSFGVILWELIARECPFADIRFMAAIEDRVLQGIRPEIPANAPPEYAVLITRCWAQEPSARPPFTEIKSCLEALINRYAPTTPLCTSAAAAASQSLLTLKVNPAPAHSARPAAKKSSRTNKVLKKKVRTLTRQTIAVPEMSVPEMTVPTLSSNGGQLTHLITPLGTLRPQSLPLTISASDAASRRAAVASSVVKNVSVSAPKEEGSGEAVSIAVGGGGELEVEEFESLRHVLFAEAGPGGSLSKRANCVAAAFAAGETQEGQEGTEGPVLCVGRKDGALAVWGCGAGKTRGSVSPMRSSGSSSGAGNIIDIAAGGKEAWVLVGEGKLRKVMLETGTEGSVEWGDVDEGERYVSSVVYAGKGKGVIAACCKEGGNSGTLCLVIFTVDGEGKSVVKKMSMNEEWLVDDEKAGKVVKMGVVSENIVLCCSCNCVGVLDLEKAKMTSVYKDVVKEGDSISAICSASKTCVWIGTTGGSLVLLEIETGKVVSTLDIFKGLPIRLLHALPESIASSEGMKNFITVASGTSFVVSGETKTVAAMFENVTGGAKYLAFSSCLLSPDTPNMTVIHAISANYRLTTWTYTERKKKD